MTQRWLFLTIFMALFIGISEANTLIPVCNLNKVDHSTLTINQIQQKMEVARERDYKCETAQLNFELYKRAIGNNSQQIEILNEIFIALKRGKYLNDYTKLLIGLGDELDQLNSEQLSLDQVKLYFKFVTKPRTNPNSQFTFGDKTLALFDEMEVAFKFFILNYPKNPFNKKITKKIKEVQKIRLSTTVSQIEFYLNRTKTPKYNREQFYRLSKEILKSSALNEIDSALYVLSINLQQSNISNDLKRDYQNKIYNLFSNSISGRWKKQRLLLKFCHNYSEEEVDKTEFFKKIVKEEIDSRVFQSNQNTLPNLLGDKAKDKMIYLPLNKKSKNKKLLALAALGAIGIIMAFDQPIMDAVQSTNGELGDDIADFGYTLGNRDFLGNLFLGTFALGLVFDSTETKNAAVAAIPALILGQLVVETMKAASHRHRPREGDGPYVFDGPTFHPDNTSFPSGHSAAAWSVATIYAEELKDKYPWSPYVLYGMAALTSFARVYQEGHWTSDVVIGALVGHFSAKFALKYYRRYLQDSIYDIVLQPTFGEINGMSLVVKKRTWDSIETWPIGHLYNFHMRTKNGVIDINKLYQETFRK